MLPLVPVLDESRPLDRLGLHAVGQGLTDGNGRRCRNGQRAALQIVAGGERKAGRPGQRGPVRPDRQGATTECARSDRGMPTSATRRACGLPLAASFPRLGPKPEAGPGEVQALGPALEGPRPLGPRPATSGMPARLRNFHRQQHPPPHQGSPSEPSGRSVTYWANVAVREAARGREAARARQAHVSAYR
jgi:hypothetical protein